MSLYLDVHVLQTVPPSNLNRDDAGSPKQAVFGGVRRARVSSQAWKRATRTAFAEHVPAERLGTRTKQIPRMLAARLAERGGLDDETARRISTSVLATLQIKPGKKATDTAYLLFFGRPQIEAIVDHVVPQLAEWAQMDDKSLAEAAKSIPVLSILGQGHPIDVALFGRMVADIPGLNVDAATQVAHAISTHPVETEFDYYTAVDDEKPADDPGASMIGTIEFTSATLYRYATVGVEQLVENLGVDVADPDGAATVAAALRTFLTSFVTSMPTGHQNSFAHRTLPDLVSVVLRDGQPVNLVSAFESPVRAQGHGVASTSIIRLADELTKTTRLWGLEPRLVASCYETPADPTEAAKLRSALGEAGPFKDVVESVVEAAVQVPTRAGR